MPAVVGYVFEFRFGTRKNRGMPNALESASIETTDIRSVHDYELVCEAKKGSNIHLTEIIRRFTPELRSLYERRSNGRCADDVLQETFMRMLTAIASFEDGRNFSAWLRGIFWHCVLDERRTYARRMRFFVTMDMRAIDLPVSDRVSEGMEEHEAAVRIARAIAELPKELRQVLKAHLKEQPTVKIAKRLRISENAVYGRLFQARRLLSKSLKAFLAV